ncbi:MAG TPA: serine/threonine-protein kinase [Kofleriaceae bacterium]
MHEPTAMWSPPQRDPELHPDQVIGGRYRVIRQLADGGMGTVYLAEHVLLRRRRAVKVLHAELAADNAMVRQFLREASAAGTLGHPHLVRSTDMGVTPAGLPYIVFEYLDGVLLTQEIYRLGGLPVARAVELAGQIAAALAAAHDARIVHLDLKSDNVLLVGHGAQLGHGPQVDQVKVLDFGIARFLDAELDVARRGVVSGTPEYISPEQIRTPDRVDARADIYALGVILYEMLTARRPFPSADAQTTLRRVLHEPPSPLGREVPPALARLIFGGMLAKSAAHRVPSMRAVEATLAAIRAGDAPRA